MVFSYSTRLLLRPQKRCKYPQIIPFHSLSFFSFLGDLGSGVSSASPTFFNRRGPPVKARDLDSSDEQVNQESTQLNRTATGLADDSRDLAHPTKGRRPRHELREKIEGSKSFPQLTKENGSPVASQVNEIRELKQKLMSLEKELERIRESDIVTKGEDQEAENEDGSFSSPLNQQSLGGKTFIPKGKGFVQSIGARASKGDHFDLVGPLPEMILFVNTLYREGYLRNADFQKDRALDLSSTRLQDSIKTAAEKFGREHQEIAKWLSGSNLKKIALFGCPSVERRTVHAAKTLRSFFSLQEDVVCRACKLKSSCKFVNRRVSKTEKLVLEDTLRVLTIYGLGLVPQHLTLSAEVRASVGQVLLEVVRLSI